MRKTEWKKRLPLVIFWYQDCVIPARAFLTDVSSRIDSRELFPFIAHFLATRKKSEQLGAKRSDAIKVFRAAATLANSGI